MNQKLEEKLNDKVSLLGYKALVKAIMNCNQEVMDEINEEYEAVISSSDSRPLL